MRVNRQTGSSNSTRSATVGGVPYISGQVTADNFLDKALLFMRTSGNTNGSHPVIRRDRDAVAWNAWTTFMRRLGLEANAAEQIGVLTLPTTLPWDFSVDADDLRDVVWDDLPYVHTHREADNLTVDERKEITQRLRLGKIPDMQAASRKPKCKSWQPDSFDEVHSATDYDKPAVASDRLLKTLRR